MVRLDNLVQHGHLLTADTFDDKFLVVGKEEFGSATAGVFRRNWRMDSKGVLQRGERKKRRKSEHAKLEM